MVSATKQRSVKAKSKRSKANAELADGRTTRDPGWREHSEYQRRFAVGLLSGRRLTRIAQRHLTLAEATGYSDAHNKFPGEPTMAVIMPDPIGPWSTAYAWIS